MNHIAIKGRLGRDPELSTTSGGDSYCTFSVAVDRNYQKKGEDKVSDWFNCKAWRQKADFISNYFSKGQEIIVVGEMQSRKYQDKQGVDRIGWEIAVDHAEFCGTKAQNENAAPSSVSIADMPTIDPSDVPF